MIQRIQSIYLLLASIAIYCLFFFPLVHSVYAGNSPVTIMATGVYQDVNGQHTHTQFFVGITVAVAVIGLLPLIIIFLYKNRKQQVTFCYSIMLVIIGLTVWMEKSVQSIIGDAPIALHNFGIGVLLSSLGVLFLVGAIKSINRDEKLVKSADRLR
jgi:hypothetical protein